MFSHLRSYFTGVIDELRVYNKALTSDEVQTLSFLKPGTVAEAQADDLVYYASFNDLGAGTDTHHKVNKIRYCATVPRI